MKGRGWDCGMGRREIRLRISLVLERSIFFSRYRIQTFGMFSGLRHLCCRVYVVINNHKNVQQSFRKLGCINGDTLQTQCLPQSTKEMKSPPRPSVSCLILQKTYSDLQKVHNTHRAVEKLRIKSESIKVTDKFNKQLVQQLGLGFLATRAKKGRELIVIWFCQFYEH